VIYRSPFFFQDAPKSGLGFRPVAGDALTASVSIIHCEGHARRAYEPERRAEPALAKIWIPHTKHAY
jgi:hypothetical protein